MPSPQLNLPVVSTPAPARASSAGSVTPSQAGVSQEGQAQSPAFRDVLQAENPTPASDEQASMPQPAGQDAAGQEGAAPPAVAVQTAPVTPLLADMTTQSGESLQEVIPSGDDIAAWLPPGAVLPPEGKALPSDAAIAQLPLPTPATDRVEALPSPVEGDALPPEDPLLAGHTRKPAQEQPAVALPSSATAVEAIVPEPQMPVTDIPAAAGPPAAVVPDGAVAAGRPGGREQAGANGVLPRTAMSAEPLARQVSGAETLPLTSDGETELMAEGEGAASTSLLDANSKPSQPVGNGKLPAAFAALLGQVNGMAESPAGERPVTPPLAATDSTLGAEVRATASSPATVATEWRAATQTDASSALRLPLQATDVDRRMADQLVWFAVQGTTTARIDVDPPELGPVQVHIVSSDDRLQVTLTTSHPSTRDVLEQNAARIRDMLQQQGMNGVDVNVSQQQREQRQPQTPAQVAQGQGSADMADDGAAAAAVLNTQRLSVTRLVDHFV